MILSKKRYAGLKVDRDGNVSNKLSVRGIVLTRRDNSNVVRSLYERVVMATFQRQPLLEIQAHVLEHMLGLARRQHALDDYIITKSIKGLNEYATSVLPTDPAKRAKRLQETGACDESEYTQLTLPAHVQLAERMRARGEQVDAGQRLEYVVAHPHFDAPLGAKFVDRAFFVKKLTREAGLEIDMLYYAKAIRTPLDQVLAAVPGAKPVDAGFAARVHKAMVAKHAMQVQLLSTYEVHAPEAVKKRRLHVSQS